MWDYVFDAFLGGAAAGPWGRRRAARPRSPRVRRPDWWKWSAGVAVVACPLPVVLGSALLFRVAMTAANDDFLFFLGLIFFFIGFIMLSMALSFLVGAIGVVLSIAADRGEARWFVLGIGAITLAGGIMLAFVPVGVLWTGSLVLAGAAAVTLGIYAPEQERTVLPR